MKVVILAGGLGTRISEDSHLRPKPMISIGDMPILWHIMKYYSHYGFNEFVICCGYKAFVIKEYFASYYLHLSDVTFDFSCENQMTIHNNTAENWKVTLVDTGLHTMTGGRIKRIRPYTNEEPFMMTYGDGVSDVDLNALLAFHRSHGKILTLTAAGIKQRFGVLEIDDDGEIRAFREKSGHDGSQINAGFMVIEPGFFEYLKDDFTVLEKEPMEALAANGHLMAYQHDGFWQCMDTQRDRHLLEELWNEGQAPWKVW